MIASGAAPFGRTLAKVKYLQLQLYEVRTACQEDKENLWFYLSTIITAFVKQQVLELSH